MQFFPSLFKKDNETEKRLIVRFRFSAFRGSIFLNFLHLHVCMYVILRRGNISGEPKRRGIFIVGFETDVYDFQFPRCLKHRASTEAAIFCCLKSQIRFYSKLIQVLPYNARKTSTTSAKKYNWPRKLNEKCQRVERCHFE